MAAGFVVVIDEGPAAKRRIIGGVPWVTITIEGGLTQLLFEMVSGLV